MPRSDEPVSIVTCTISRSTLRLLEYSDFSAMSRGMVCKVLEALQAKDPPHYAALIAAVG
jgi:hypothetical protein